MPNLFHNKIDAAETETFRQQLAADNIRRGKTLSLTILVFESILMITDACTAYLRVDRRFHFNRYLILYAVMAGINAAYLLVIARFEGLRGGSVSREKKTGMVTVVYLTLIMSWGSVVSLMDQRLYGHLMAFMVTMMISSVLYYLDTKMRLAPFVFSVLIVAVGLPFFQSSSDVLVGHYVNLCVFIVICWVASEMIFQGYVHDFNNRILLQKSKVLLEREIDEKRDINIRLAKANFQLRELALVDELTEIPNRRGFRNYIDLALEGNAGKDPLFSIIMIDIDFFKQFNDHYGHSEGDRVLVMVARQIDAISTCAEEFFCRWGGEEFIYCVFNLNPEDTLKLAETIREKVSELAICHGYSDAGDTISVSIGTCTMAITEREEIQSVIDHADRALYMAKSDGRNCVRSSCGGAGNP